MAGQNPALKFLATQLDGLLGVARQHLDLQTFEKLKGCTSAAVEVLQGMVHEQAALKARVADLAVRLAKHQEDIDSLNSLEQQADEDRQTVLLDQLAVTVDTIITYFVFDPSCRPISLLDLQDKMEELDEKDEKAAKWRKVVVFAQRQGVSIGQLSAASMWLREHCYSESEGTDEERERTTPAQLLEWATQTLQGDVQTLLKFLEPLTLHQRPLVPRSDVATLFDAVIP